ncbi:MAG: Mut7-C RNAse domain-containing protein [Nitrososphaerales archaeon]
MTKGNARPTRFVADAMLGSLARKMRALGFDTLYYSDGDDDGIMGIARSEGRVVLTADRSLAEHARRGRVSVLLIPGNRDSRRLASLLAAAKASGVSLVRGEPFCSICGGDLQTMKRTDVAGQVPPSVERRHRLFLRCVECGQYYWKGSHWKKLRWLDRILRAVPVATVS